MSKLNRGRLFADEHVLYGNPSSATDRPARRPGGVGLMPLIAMVLLAVGTIGCGRGGAGAASAPITDRVFTPVAVELPDFSRVPTARANEKTIDSNASPDWVEAFTAGGPMLLARLEDPELKEAAETGRRRVVKTREEATAQRNWEIRFPKGQTVETYAKQLDFFGIELAVVLPEGQLIYISRLSSDKPTTRTGRAADEKRFYLTWRGGELSLADLELLHRAGVEARNRVLLKLLPDDLERKLAELERTAAGARADRVRKTRFDIKPTENGYEFVVVEQWFQ